MNLWLLAVLVLPSTAAPLALLFGQRVGLAAGAAAVAAQWLLMAGLPAGESFGAGGVVLQIGPTARLFIPIFGAVTIAACSFAPRRAELFIPGALVALSALSGVAMADNPQLGALLLEIAAVAALFVAPRSGARVSSWWLARTLTFSVLSSVVLVAAFALAETARIAGATGTTGQLVLAMLAIGLAIRLAIVPFHLWLPPFAEVAAPACAALLLLAVNVGALALASNAFIVEPWLVADGRSRALLAGGCALSAVSGAGLALFQPSLRRLAAFSIAASMGYVGFGLAVGTAVSASAGVAALIAQCVGGLLVWGAIAQVEERVGAAPFGMVRGLGARLPVAAAAFVLGGLTLSGFPLLLGFGAHWQLWRVAADASVPWAAALILGSLALTAAYARGFVTVFLGPPADPAIRADEPAAIAAFSLLSAVSIAFGLFPSALAAVAWAAATALPFVR